MIHESSIVKKKWAHQYLEFRMEIFTRLNLLLLVNLMTSNIIAEDSVKTQCGWRLTVDVTYFLEPN